MAKLFSSQHLERIQEAHNKIMQEETARVSNDLNTKLGNIVELFGYGQSEIQVSVSISTAYKITIQGE
jgi:hypothetical protein